MAAGLRLTLGPGWIAETWQSLFGSCSNITSAFANTRKRKHEYDVQRKLTQTYKKARIEAKYHLGAAATTDNYYGPNATQPDMTTDELPHQLTYPSLETTSMTVDIPWTSQAAKGHNRHAMPSTDQSAIALPVTSYMCTKYAVPTTVPGSALTGMGPLFKPSPWTSLRPFALKRELSDHPDKAFVKQLISDLSHGCSIGYKKNAIFLSCN